MRKDTHCKIGVLIFWRSISTRNHAIFRVFFACFLTHCKIGVLIFWRSIFDEKSSEIIDFHRKTDGSKGEIAPWIFEHPKVHLKKSIKFYRKNTKPKQASLVRCVEYFWSENNFIFSILERVFFTILQYLWRKNDQKLAWKNRFCSIAFKAYTASGRYSKKIPGRNFVRSWTCSKFPISSGW